MNIYVIGANGQLGTDIVKALSPNHNVSGGGSKTFDITNTEQYPSFFGHKYDMIINTAAYHNVPMCEKHPQQAYGMNRDIPAQLARFTAREGIRFMHFSTDYVFDGIKNTPYVETDRPNPLNEYGLSKYEGEQAVMEQNPGALILRVSCIYGAHASHAKGYNFPLKILQKARSGEQLRVTDAQTVSPTYTVNIAAQIAAILDMELSGIVHCADKASISWHAFALAILEEAGLSIEIEKGEVYDDGVKRPQYSVLGNGVLNKLNIDIMRPYKESIKALLKEI